MRLILLLAFCGNLFAQYTIHALRTPIQWMDLHDQKVMAVIKNLESPESVELYFSNGETFSVPLPSEKGKELLTPQVALTKDGIDLITIQATNFRFGPSDEYKARTSALQFYFISYESIKEGAKEWTLRDEINKDIPPSEMIPLNTNRFLAFPIGSNGVMGYDWATFGFNGNKLVKIDQGYWLDSESAGYYFDRTEKRRVSKHQQLANSWNSSIVHTKNYLTIFNHLTGRMLVFSKETGKLKRRAKLTPAVPPEQDSEFVCAIPVITLQPDLDDSIVVLAHKDINILKSMDMIEEYNNLNKEGKAMEAFQFLMDSKSDYYDIQWYRVNLESGIIEKRNRGDVPDTWDNTIFPFFIPFGYDSVLWGGVEKSFPELIGTVFKKSTPPKESEETAAEAEMN
jgi:hypothetical protein